MEFGTTVSLKQGLLEKVFLNSCYLELVTNDTTMTLEVRIVCLELNRHC